jgi:predicted DNA-binding transcriptional regulator AlpA
MSEIHPALSAFVSSRRKYELARTREAGRARQAAKIKELRTVLLALGYETLSEQAAVLGLKRPTVWAMFNSDHRRGGMSSNTVKQLLAAKAAPQQLKQVIREYVSEKLAGAYGHNSSALRLFRLRAGISADQN